MTILPRDFEFVATLVHDQSGIVIGPGKEYLVEARLAPVAATAGLTLAEFVSRLRHTCFGPIHHQAVEAMMTSETFFFREPHQFEALRTVMLPELMERHATSRRLNVWCAAASSGQEPYSLALLIRTGFPALDAWDIRILATDLSSAMITRARRGCYQRSEVARGLPLPMLAEYFQQVGAGYQIRESIRSMVEFRELNLVQPWGDLAGFDIVFLRNILIYFDDVTRRKLLARIRGSMRSGGYLFTGNAESASGLDRGYQRVLNVRGAFKVSHDSCRAEPRFLPAAKSLRAVGR